MNDSPRALKVEKKILQHNQERIDNYAWLRDANWQKITQGELSFKNQAILDYIEKENAYTKKYLKEDYPEIQQNLYNEILGRIKEDDQSYPIQKGKYLYFDKTLKGLNYPILCRAHQSTPQKEEVYFDVNQQAHKYGVYFLKKNETNDNEQLLAYMFNTTGSMECSLQIRDLKTGHDLDFIASNLNGSFTWIDNDNLAYIERDESSRGKKVFQLNIHQLDRPKLIFEKPEELESMFMSIDLSSDKQYLILSMESGSSCCSYIRPALSQDDFTFFVGGDNDIQYDLDHNKNKFFIHTNKEAENFKVLTSSDEDPFTFSELIAEDKNLYLEGFHLYSHFLILDRKNLITGLSQIDIFDLQTQTMKNVKFPEAAYTFSIFGSYELETKTIRLFYESPVTPEQDMDLDLETGQLKTLKTQEVPNYNPQNYVTTREFANSHDGKQIPITLITKKELKKKGVAPCYVYGYGSYGLGMESHYSSSIFSLVDRGFCVAIAHIRGGDDLGYTWYTDGKMSSKHNTFKDYISVCEHLIKNAYTKQGHIVGHGASAGGLLMGVVANWRPDLFKAIVAEVPFVDLINTISDPTLPLTPPEWEEWGNPIESAEDYSNMMSYSPYDNICHQDYPHMLYNSGISDEQVTYWEPLKMVAKLREYKTDSNNLFLNMKMNAGHAGASKRYEWIEDNALVYHFILKCFELS